MSEEQPSPNRPNGRGPRGQFEKGNPGGPGNPFGKRTMELKAVFLKVLTPSKMRKLATKLVEKAIAGDLAAAKLCLEYGIGKPTDIVTEERLAELERNRTERQASQ